MSEEIKFPSNMQESLETLITALKELAKTNDAHFYSTLRYYMVIRWLKLVRRNAYFTYNKEKDCLNWDLPIGA